MIPFKLLQAHALIQIQAEALTMLACSTVLIAVHQQKMRCHASPRIYKLTAVNKEIDE